MKKILNLITISTLTTVFPTPLLSNISSLIERLKQDVGMSNSNNEYVQIKEIKYFDSDSVLSVACDSKNNVYFGTYAKGAYVLKNDSDTPTKINGINGTVRFMIVDKQDNVYFATKGAYVLKKGSDTPTKINGVDSNVNSIAVDKDNNVYLGTEDGAYVLKNDSDTSTKINGINDENVYSVTVDNQENVYFGMINSLCQLLKGSAIPNKVIIIKNKYLKFPKFDSKDNLYFGTEDGLYKLSAGSDTPTKINEINNNILTMIIDSKDNLYFGTENEIYILKKGETTPTKINNISSVSSMTVDNNSIVYIGKNKGASFLQTALSWTKEQSQFNLIDSTKKKTWTRNNLLTVDGELNIEIKNNNIDKVLFDNVLQPQTAKQWNINVKPETSEKDHNLQVIFTLDGKQYTSKIIVSMQAKIDPPIPPKPENLSDVIKFDIDNNLGNIYDNNNETIISAIIQKNSRIIDFSQIEIEKKDMHSATLIATKDSKSYQGSVVVKYNVVPATIVDLKIDLNPTSPSTQTDIDYAGQIDKTIITNTVNSFYYANSESKIKMIKPTASSVITGFVYGADNQWNKTSQNITIDPTNGIVLDGSQLATKNGKYVIELQDNLGNHNNIYLQIAPKQEIAHYFDTDNGKQFEKWAKANGHDNIREYSFRKLNNLFEESKSWIQQANDNQLANAVADWFKIKGNVSSKQIISKEQIVEQLKKQVPKNITIDKFDTSNYDLNKVSFEIKGMQFQPNEKVEIVIKYGSENFGSFILQIQNNNPSNNNKKELTVWAVIGIVIGSLLGLLFIGWLLKKFVITPFILEPMRKKKSEAFQRQTEKDIAQMKADEAEEETKRKGKK